MSETTQTAERWPGEQLGLPEKGQGSLASWRSRITAIVLDWAISMIAARLIFGVGALTGSDWRSFTILGIFFVQSSVLTALLGGSAGKLITRLAVIQTDWEKLGFLRSVARQFMVCLAIPAMVIGVHRRGLHDLACGSVVVNRR